ncbi:uncharacterized protein LOC128222544 isoform X1 [Mya arenaria]|nr:uncharacterized protein LOC128222544 isoform X1 [Mya arenaria]XP_052787557.1 uncharacterized protein LOC128222544 isoform X1 [Mya arenaria]XP_052787558.1 uncharacterized protein LOC128222544 isoform X1 [Mya arenaria]XP_052787559.1 uncharacterized protein LOC128222544 isoform X1 [Mya arenaria]XP_052787560.1 uncharacterized protein LOC128222544 isoform X1 [Mya arenaria]XP_052787561.1 uncharacterized protein LOC128222544 isoform X1 [Mya arenaria]XP_052787562.1 uncharacterized protein LOC12822
MDEHLAFNGKAGKLDERVFSKLKLLCRPVKARQDNAQQGNETTLVSQDDVPFYNTRLVLHTVEKPWTGDLSEEEIENNLEQIILHYAIVPQVAYYRNEQTVSFVAPYFGGGTLDEVIQKERDKTAAIETEIPSDRKPEIALERPQTLEWKDKLRILYQICRAIEYLHQPPKCERKPVSHGNICMQNVLLDEQKNARLLFFTPKSVEGGVGEEQFQEDKNKDVQAFIEMTHDFLKQSRKKTDVLARKQTAVTMTDIKKELESGLRGEGINWWTPSQDVGKTKDKCEICCINKPEKTFQKLTHDRLCGSKIQMCVGCLWNWQYNPVKCHTCDQDKIRSPVGDCWGAIIIAGTDEKQEITKSFEDDIEKLKDRVITKATLMGVRNNVVTVKKSNTTYGEQLEKAFNNVDTPEITTIVLVYSGHHGDGKFQLDTYPLKDSELEMKINCLKHVTKVIVFLDCCYPKKFNLGDKAVLQINAVTSQQKAICGQAGSQFVNDIVDVLTKPWECNCCKNRPLIRDYDIHRHFNNHLNCLPTETSQHSYTQGDIDHILTFRTVDPGWQKALDESLESSPFQKLRNKLFELYKENASTLRVRIDIDDALEKVYEEPKLTLKENGKEERPIDLNNIFRSKEGTMAKTIFVEGEPGSGKSSLCKKIVHDWCETKQEPEGQSTDKWCEMLSQFEFVFYVILREAKDECNISNMILKYIIARNRLEQESERILLKDILETNTCLLLLDGLDEWQHPEKCTLSEKTPHVDTSWKKCTLFTTTRPYKLAELKIDCSKIGNHVMLKGVTYPDKLVKKIVSRLNTIHGTTKLKDQCITDIKEKLMWHFSKCPIMLAHIVWLWYKGKLSEDMKRSDLYRTLLRERWFELCEKNTSCNESKYSDMINALSQIAFEQLFAKDEDSTIVFEIDQEENTIFKNQKGASLDSGIISCTNIPGEYSPKYHFLHKSFQEYLAALYLSKDISTSILHIKKTYQIHRSESGTSLSEVLIFLCGLNSKAAEELSRIMNELFTEFCERDSNYSYEQNEFQKKIIQGQIELDRGERSGVKLSLQHLHLEKYNRLDRDEITVLEENIKTNPSCKVSLYIYLNPTLALSLAKSNDNQVLDLENWRGLKYVELNANIYKDVAGLNVSNLVKCKIQFSSPQQAPNLASSFYNSDMKTMKSLQVSKCTNLNWLHKDLEPKGILKVGKGKVLKWLHRHETLNLRRIENLEHLTELGLEQLSYSDVVNLPVSRLYTLRVEFIKLQRAPKLMSSLLPQGICKNEREGLFSHLKDLYLEKIHMSEEQFIRLSQSFIKAGGTSLQLWDCSIEPEYQNECEQQVVSSECTTRILLGFVTITVEGFIRLIDYVTRCGHSVDFHLGSTTLESNPAVEQPSLPMLVAQPISADYTTELELSLIKMSTEQMCQIVGRINQLDHSVTLTLEVCTVKSDEYNPLRHQMVPPPNTSLNYTKHIKIKHMDISETLCLYVASSAIYFGYTCEISACFILPSEVPHADNLHFPQMAAIHSPGHTAKLRFYIVSIPQHVVERLASQAAISGHLVECVLDKCEVGPPPDVWSLKEKIKEDAAIQIEEFEPNNDELPFSFEPGQIWSIRFKTTAKKSALAESTAEKPEVTE